MDDSSVGEEPFSPSFISSVAEELLICVSMYDEFSRSGETISIESVTDEMLVFECEPTFYKHSCYEEEKSKASEHKSPDSSMGEELPWLAHSGSTEQQ